MYKTKGRKMLKNFTPTNKCFNAFTLAETLITIGIIGIVAALTIPNLIHNYKANLLQFQLKRANSLIQQGFKRMADDEINISEVLENKDYATIKKYFKTSACQVPKSHSVAGYKSYHGYTKTYVAADQVWSYPPFCLTDGTLILLGRFDRGNKNPFIMVDINGWKTKPDKYGYDVFFWMYNSKTQSVTLFYKDLLPSNHFERDKWYGCPSIGAEAGFGCSAQALKDPDYFKNLKF
jgi:type II secretory pathway pseudopilin PulG